ncbi:MAG: class I tRNA ligase family protein, partial [Candidatus Paceibacterota bacterium]
ADYVLGSYGTVAIMAVPAHDERDFAFAKKFNLKIISVISAHILEKTEKDTDNELNKYINHEEPYIKEGVIINSEKFSGLSSENAKKKITEFVGGKLVTKYKLRDWVFSRQRYWGEPIPVIHCEKCGVVPVPDKDLPVVLPKVKNYEPTGTGESPLAGIEKWVNTKCPKCGGKAKRETNTMPQWAGSSWYWLRYCDPKNTKEFADKKKIKYWTPVDLYFGGMEHTTLHLLYSRFWNQFLFDRGLVTTSEPYIKRVPHGIILGPDGEKMSKSKGNVVNPDDVAKVYGVDTMRLYMAFLGPHGNQIAWNDKGIIGTRRFIERVFSISEFISKEEPKEVTTAINKTIKKVGEDIENIAFNTAVSALMICVNSIYEHKKITKKSFAKFLQILAPLAPHITEELWSNLGNKKSIFLSKWPEIDEFFLVEDVSISVQINGKAREVMTLEKDTPENEMIEKAKNIGTIPERLAGKEIIKTIAVKNRVVNFVIRE